MTSFNFAFQRRELSPRTEGDLPKMTQQLWELMLGAWTTSSSRTKLFTKAHSPLGTDLHRNPPGQSH